MIIPVKCFTCGKVLADKYRYYQTEIRKKKVSKKMEIDSVIYLTPDFISKTPEGEILDNLGLIKYCCRRHMLTHVDIE
jgi:DNA-directed RNA polymerase subunit N (RpoN/RPB10)